MPGSAWLAGSPSSLLLFDGGVVVDVNAAACRELSRAREALLGHGFVGSLADEDRVAVEATLGSLDRPGAPSPCGPIVVRRLRADDDDPGVPAVTVIELRPVIEPDDLGEGFTPELREKEQRLRRQAEASR